MSKDEKKEPEKPKPVRVREAYIPKEDGVWVNGVRIDPKPKDLNDGE